MTDDEITQIIIGCAYEVHNKLGAGFFEKVYQNALRIELRKKGLRVIQEAPINVWYENEIVGKYSADLLVEDRIVIELKAVQSLTREHEVQLVNYLTATKTETGLLLNFGSSVQVRRKYRRHKQSQSPQSILKNPVHPV